MKLFLSPHNDDECLFGSALIVANRPLVLVVFDSHVQVARGALDCGPDRRRMETVEAMKILNLGSAPQFLGFRDDQLPSMTALEGALRQFGQPEMVYAPAVEEGGHPQHSLVGSLAAKVFRNVTHFMTYTNRGKSEGRPVPFEPEWISKKFQALACYRSQIAHPANQPHFLRQQLEYTQQ